MGLIKDAILPLIILSIGVTQMVRELSGFPEFSYFKVIAFTALISCMPLMKLIKKRVERMKDRFNLTGIYSLEELEKIRIEKEYQEHVSREFNLH